MNDAIRRRGAILVSTAMSMALLATPATASDATNPLEPVIGPVGSDGVVAERAAYGLPTDARSLEVLRSSSRDVGTAEWGIAMTAEEEEAIDIAGRMAFADDISRNLVPVLRKMSSYAGEWIDQEAGGSLVVLLTHVDDVARSQIESLMPARSRGLRIVQVAHTYSELVDAIDVIHTAWEKSGGPRPLSIAVDTRNNAVVVEVLREDQADASFSAELVSGAVGIPVRVAANSDSRGGDVACTDRDHCTNPMKAGNIMRGGSVNNDLRCTVAFQIVYQGDIQALSAGHCSYYYDLWYHQGYGTSAFANVQQTLWQSGGRDILRMTFPDAQASELIYGTAGPSTLASSPGVAILNETLCVSLGRSNRKDCGRVEHTSVKYWSGTIGFWVWGGDLVAADISPAPIIGDSGSPIFRERFIEQPPNSYYQRTAIGVLTTEFSEYARLDNTLADWNASIY